ncbi:TetR family transcriptional regulator [Nocardioides sp. zg-579]|uniref:TetR family transcriptional regulator n=1 Tax=Nocardioides marmotae TaxID=2663857 RepID=A0A6I3JFG3_9ACTN|nr:TetR/AcrR family transcriptional regulator [Nocardioides marmotae]MCR6033175.1 TetR family transcriptional regulator [Gordonia jinghuaiqii]MTB96829.1 TetR family transcriptional regulator [Nocardioides marmotae]QKE02969.1 TetR/AcrR family transcriptional regulator [Nocardioides marmotae]
MSPAATRGDQRRAALLEALDQALRKAGPHARLEDINVADLSRRAGVTRSAFYFYFDNKAAAVAALMDEMEDDAWDAAGLLGGDGAMSERIATAIRSVVEGWRRRTHVHRAMLEARATSPAVRERWEQRIAAFVEVVAALVESERAAGRAPAGPPATALATALLDLNDRTLERLVRAADTTGEDHIDAVVHLWTSAIYGRTTP